MTAIFPNCRAYRRQWRATGAVLALLWILPGALLSFLPLALLCFLPLTLLWLAPALVSAESTKSTPSIVLLAAGDLRGEIKPCGCSPEGQMGGLPRRLTYLQRALEGGGDSTLLVDLGNNFPPPSPQGRLKVKLIQDMLSRFAPQAVLPGPNELALGTAVLAGSLPYLISNDEAGKKIFQSHRTVNVAGLRIGIFGYLSPAEVYQKSQSRFRLVPVNERLLQKWRAVRQAQGHQRTVLLFRGGDDELATIVRSGLFDAMVAGNPNADELNQVVQREAAGLSIPQVPTKGQGMLRMELRPNGQAGAATRSKPVVDWLTDKVADHPQALAPFQHYDEEVKKLFFAKLETMNRQKAESPYVGAQACKECHAAPFAIWGASRHATAVKTLEKVGKQFDPECLACHVVGMERGGFLSKDLTPLLAGVQCENCHGPGRAHGLNPKANRTGLDARRAGGLAQKVGEATCRTCHVGSHSPSFDFKTYWPKIQHTSNTSHNAAAKN